MPRIDRRTISRRLLLIRRVPQDVVEFAILGGCAEVKFANGIAHAIARIIIIRFSAIRYAGVRGFSHPDAHESHGHGTLIQASGLDPASSLSDCALRKSLPDSA